MKILPMKFLSVFEVLNFYNCQNTSFRKKNDYRIARNFGGVKLWRFCLNRVLAKKNLANGNCRSFIVHFRF